MIILFTSLGSLVCQVSGVRAWIWKIKEKIIALFFFFQDEEEDSQRSHQLELLRQLCLPLTCYLLHNVLYSTEQYKQVLSLLFLIWRHSVVLRATYELLLFCSVYSSLMLYPPNNTDCMRYHLFFSAVHAKTDCVKTKNNGHRYSLTYYQLSPQFIVSLGTFYILLN